MSPDHALIYEQIHADNVRSQEIAEKRCWKLHNGKYKSSLELKKAYNTVDYWKKHKEYVKGNCQTILARDLIKIQKRLGILYEMLSLQQIQVKLNEAEQTLKQVKKEPQSSTHLA